MSATAKAEGGEEEEGVSEGAVVAEVVRLTEAAACLHRGSTRGVSVTAIANGKLTVLSREALAAAEAELSMQCEMQSSGMDADGNELSKRQ